MYNVRKDQLNFLSHAIEVTGYSASMLARKAGLSTTTITRFISNESQKELSQQTLERICSIAGYKSYSDYLVSVKNKNLKRRKNYTEKKSVVIEDGVKFEIYETSKKLLEKKYGSASPDKIKDISEKVLNSMFDMNTGYVTDSLVMYVIEKDSLDNNYN